MSYEQMMHIGIGLGVVFLAIAVVIFFALGVFEAICELTGFTRRKKIAAMRTENQYPQKNTKKGGSAGLMRMLMRDTGKSRKDGTTNTEGNDNSREEYEEKTDKITEETDVKKVNREAFPKAKKEMGHYRDEQTEFLEEGQDEGMRSSEEEQDEGMESLEGEQDEKTESLEEEQDEVTESLEEEQDEGEESLKEEPDETTESLEEEQDEMTESLEQDQDDETELLDQDSNEGAENFKAVRMRYLDNQKTQDFEITACHVIVHTDEEIN